MLDLKSTVDIAEAPVVSKQSAADSAWTYEEAFKRNRGLISAEEQQKLRDSRVAIAGMGGVGGVHLITLARLGIGKFTIADPDEFEVANFNRQYGATISNLGRNKAAAMAAAALDINPELDIEVISEAVSEYNVDQFLASADLYVDGLDFFAIDARRLVFRRAAEMGIWSVTAGPIGFSTAWLAFDPEGMSFDRYFDLQDHQSKLAQLVAFAVGLTPKATHLGYMNLSKVEPTAHTTPCSGLACQLAAGVASDTTSRVLLGKRVLAAPYYSQFDPHVGASHQRKLWKGNRHPIQKLKRKILANKFSHLAESVI